MQKYALSDVAVSLEKLDQLSQLLLKSTNINRAVFSLLLRLPLIWSHTGCTVS